MLPSEPYNVHEVLYPKSKTAMLVSTWKAYEEMVVLAFKENSKKFAFTSI